MTALSSILYDKFTSEKKGIPNEIKKPFVELIKQFNHLQCFPDGICQFPDEYIKDQIMTVKKQIEEEINNRQLLEKVAKKRIELYEKGKLPNYKKGAFYKKHKFTMTETELARHKELNEQINS